MKGCRKLWKDVLVGLMITLVLLAGAEVFLRWRVQGKRLLLDEWETADPRMGFKPKSNFTYKGIPVTNSLGFRGPEFSPEKRPGVFRIIALGDSVTFGGVADRKCDWPAHLQRELARVDMNRYEVVNGGVEGYGTWHVLQRLRHEVLKLNPDMIIVLVGWNDLYGYSRLQTQVDDPMELQKAKGHWFNRVVLKSYVMKWLTKRALSIAKRGQDPPEIERKRGEAFVPVAALEHYRQIVRVAKSAGIPWAVLATQPSVAGSDRLEEYQHLMHFPRFAQSPDLFMILWEKYSTAIRRVANEERAVLIDLAAVIRLEVPDSGRYFHDSVNMEFLEGKSLSNLNGWGFGERPTGGRQNGDPSFMG
jgi:lysophospholipase L1-like esterase